MKTVRVNLENRSYQVVVGTDVLGQAGSWLKEVGIGDRLVIITNPVVQGLYGSVLKESLLADGFAVDILTVADGEEQKSLDVAGRLYNELTAVYAERATPILALGGGVIGDLAGFVAATYLRGVPLVQIPTTLLAQVDSSIGGKVAVNHGLLKNKIGAFYQPRLVLSDTAILKTLPVGEFANGMAEVIKSAVIRDRDLFTFIETNLDKIRELDDATMEEVVFRSAGSKARVVEQDEMDLGLRNILNFGHTIGHALETVSDFGVEHGQAVAMGMVAAASIARRMGILEDSELARLRSVIEGAGLPVEMPRLDIERVIQAMKHDKKIVGGKVRFVLPRAIGDVFVTDEVSLSLVEEVLGG
ncbi:MAG: 3-dehydroquinate synthase [Dehalococcoidales bacterium]|nr:3-dehydroquinate synthase [Dehalococcoidales bacterium]